MDFVIDTRESETSGCSSYFNFSWTYKAIFKLTAENSKNHENLISILNNFSRNLAELTIRTQLA